MNLPEAVTSLPEKLISRIFLRTCKLKLNICLLFTLKEGLVGVISKLLASLIRLEPMSLTKAQTLNQKQETFESL